MEKIAFSSSLFVAGVGYITITWTSEVKVESLSAGFRECC